MALVDDDATEFDCVAPVIYIERIYFNRNYFIEIQLIITLKSI